MMLFLKWAAIGFAAFALLVVVAGQMGLFGGRTPNGLGVRDGRLKPPSKTPNSVSSQAGLWAGHVRREQAQIAPLALAGDGPETIARLRTITESMPGAEVIDSRDDYLYVQFSSRWLGFVDDTEFWFDPAARVIQVRSSSRVGRGDLGVNRARVEAIRSRLVNAEP
jgi:uncharacterized protein (DUF1499 family)